VSRAQQLSAGVAKHFTSGAKVTFVGGTFTPAEITAKLQSLVNLRSEVDTAKATVKAKVAAEAANMPALRAFQDALVSYVKAVYGASPDVLADFGINLKARASVTAETKAAANAKRAATRKARNTVGPKKKKAIKGAVTGIVVTPITAAAPTVATPAPAVPATSGTAPGTTPHTAP
jgi:hypothetical protein